MPSERENLNKQLSSLRDKAKRRMERLDTVMKNDRIPYDIRDWAERRYIAMEEVTERSKYNPREGKRTIEQMQQSVKALEGEVKRVSKSLSIDSPFEITQMQLNLASVKDEASVYTQQEASIFYRATQKIWQKTGMQEKGYNRNKEILEYFNSIRAANAKEMETNLPPLTLEQIVDYVLKENEIAVKMNSIDPSKPMTEEEKQTHEEAQKADTADHAKGSPTKGVGEAVIEQIRDAFDDLLILPDPLAAEV